MAGSSGHTSKLLDGQPPIFVFRTHFTDEELGHFEEALECAGAELTYDIGEAKLLLSKVTKKTRLLFDLRAKNVTIEEASDTISPDKTDSTSPDKTDSTLATHSTPELIEIKDDVSTASEGEPDRKRSTGHATQTGFATLVRAHETTDALSATELVQVVRTEWFTDSMNTGQLLPVGGYTTLSGRMRSMIDVKTADNSHLTQAPRSKPSTQACAMKPKPLDHSILERAKVDATSQSGYDTRSLKRKFNGTVSGPRHSREAPAWAPGQAKHAHLLHATTSEEDHGFSSDLPEPPDWVVKGIKYACQRITLTNSPNEEFIAQLRKIKLARLLTSDEIGVRAYSTSIAALLSYDHKFVSPREILRLPGCDAKIANLYVEWMNTGKIKAVEEIEADRDLTILRLFYNIWGVGALTARELYFDRGWQDLDDLVEYHWKSLSRVQQIGVKYYDEFLDAIPRAEVEKIGRVVHEHAVRVRDADVQSMIVGGYRRGKAFSGDVDMIVSHPDEERTLDIITDIVASLEEEGWITHTLLLSTNSTRREQQTLPFSSGDMHGGHGFDSLDKALVVWQNPEWPTKEADLAENPSTKNPNVHRRVDIIIAPWRTVGCAVLGWSGGTTFQRDVRRYVKHSFGWKFDSSGVRDRGNGEVLDLEGYQRYDGKLGSGRAKTLLQAEKRVFEGMQLEYREAWERVTD